MKLEIEGTLHDDESVREKLAVMDSWTAFWDDSRTICPVDWQVEASKALVPGKRYRIVLTIEEILDDGNPSLERRPDTLGKLICPWCGYAEIDVGVEMLAKCRVCGAEEVGPEQRETELGQRDGWRESAEMVHYDANWLARLEGFARASGATWKTYTELGRLMNLPEGHPLYSLDQPKEH